MRRIRTDMGQEPSKARRKAPILPQYALILPQNTLPLLIYLGILVQKSLD